MAIREKGSLSTTVVVSRLPDASGNWVCDGTADDVEINEALAYVNTLGGGRVMLKQGTFTLAAPIVFPGNNIWLRGMGRSTFIDGDALTTGNHAIELTGRTGCAIKKLAIQTQDGGDKTCHCIFIDDGCNDLSIMNVGIVDSDSDGVHIEGTSHVDIHLHGLRVNDVDDNGISVNMDGGHFCDRLMIDKCMILSAGAMGIHLQECRYTEIISNVIATSTQSGIAIDDACIYCNISNCVSVVNTQHGILLTTTATHISVEGCVVALNGYHGIYLNGVFDSSVASCLCQGNDSGDTATYDGIYLDGTSERNAVIGCHCCNNDRYGIAVEDKENNVVGNYVHTNGHHGIHVAGAECKISGNHVTDNSQKTADTYHGINVTADGDYCHIEGNYCYGGVDHDMQEDGIHLVSGAEHCSIVGNFCYYLQGDGIALAGSNTGTLIQGNKCYYMEDENGIVVEDSTDCQVIGNHCMSNYHHGIFLHNADRCNCTGNTCTNNDRGASATYDGIMVNNECVDVLVEGNFCYDNDRAGIYAEGIRTNIIGNHCTGSGTHGIYVNAVDCKVQNNHCFDNSQNTAGSSYGIALSGGADRCTVVGNTCDDPGDSQGDGINLADGATQCQITDNYCYNAYDGGASAGNGITLAANNADCLIEGNYVYLNDGYGIQVLAGCVRTSVNNNQVNENGLDGITIGSADCSIQGNWCRQNGTASAGTYHGISLDGNADRCAVNGNHVWTDSGDTQYTEDGIHLADGAIECQITDNYCYDLLGSGITLAANNTDCKIEGNFIYLCDDYGIEVLAGCVRTSINDNQCIQNGLHGITCGSADCQINDNYIYDTGQTGAETYHGIYLDANGDRCQICGNHIIDPGNSTENGIHLAAGAVEVMINDNYIYNLMGDGIMLAGDNLDCQIIGNTCSTCDDNGIYIFNESDFCVVTGNKCKSNTLNGILISESDYCTVTGNVCNANTQDGIHVAGDATHEANYNTLTGNVCTGNTQAGIELSEVGAGDCTKTIVIGNQLLGNTAAALTDGGTNTEIGHNITV